MFAATTSTRGESNEIDVTSWLRDNKLDYLESQFEQKRITINELLEFDQRDLR